MSSRRGSGGITVILYSESHDTICFLRIAYAVFAAQNLSTAGYVRLSLFDQKHSLDFCRAREQIILPHDVVLKVIADDGVVLFPEFGEPRRIGSAQRLD